MSNGGGRSGGSGERIRQVVIIASLVALLVVPAGTIAMGLSTASMLAPTPASGTTIAPATNGSGAGPGSNATPVSLCSGAQCGGPETTATAVVPCGASGCGAVNASGLSEVKASPGGYAGDFDPCVTVLTLGSPAHPISGSKSYSTQAGSATLTVTGGVAFWVSLKACATAYVHISWCCISWHHPFGELRISAGVSQIQFTEDYGYELQAGAAVTGSGSFNANDFGDPDLAIDLFDTQIPLLDVLGIPVLTLDINADIALEYSATLSAGASGNWTLLSPAPGSGCSATLGSSWTGSTDSSVQTWTPSGGWTTSTSATHCDSLDLNSFYGSLIGRIGPYLSVGLDLLDGLATLTAWAFLFGQVSLYAGVTDLTTGVVTNLAAPACDPGGGGNHCQWTGPGSCGSQYVVDGLTILPMLYANGFQPSGYLPPSQATGVPWAVACAALGLEVGFNWSLLWSSYSGTFWYLDYIFDALPLAATAVVCNVATPSCTPAFTLTHVAYEPWSWAWDPARLDIYPGSGMVVLTPLLQRSGANYEEMSATWSSPPIELANGSGEKPVPCGYITSGQSLSYANTTSGLLPPLAAATATVSASVEDWVPPANPPNGTICQFHLSLNGLPLQINNAQLSETTFNVLLSFPPPPVAGGTGAPYGGVGPGPYPWSFVESGLPAGETFQVTLNGVPMSLTTDGNSDTLVFSEANGTYSYTTLGVAGYSTAWHGQGHGSGTVHGAAITTMIEFRPSSYLITLNVTGFPNNGTLNATVGGIAHTGVFIGGTAFDLVWGLVPTEVFPNGTYAWSVTPIPGYSASWSGSVTVSGADATVYLVLIPENRIVFQETGLPAGDAWTASIVAPSVQYGAVAHNTTSSLTIPVPIGTFPYTVLGPAGYVVSGSPTGSVTVTGFNVTQTVNVRFVAGKTVSVSFTGTNVPPAAGWCAAIAWTTCTNGRTLSWTNLTPGTYSYSVRPASPYEGYSEAVKVGGRAAAGSGTIAVKANEKVTVRFTQVDYALTITESGLAAGTHWTVSVRGAFNGVNKTESVTSHGTSATFKVPNGSFALSVKTVKGYAESGPSVAVMDGNATTVALVFSSTGTALVPLGEELGPALGLVTVAPALRGSG